MEDGSSGGPEGVQWVQMLGRSALKLCQAARRRGFYDTWHRFALLALSHCIMLLPHPNATQASLAQLRQWGWGNDRVGLPQPENQRSSSETEWQIILAGQKEVVSPWNLLSDNVMMATSLDKILATHLSVAASHADYVLPPHSAADRLKSQLQGSRRVCRSCSCASQTAVGCASENSMLE